MYRKGEREREMCVYFYICKCTYVFMYICISVNMYICIYV